MAFGRELKYLRSISLVERLFVRKDVQKFAGVVHEEAQLLGDVKRLNIKTPLLHHSRDSVRDSLQKMTQYSLLGAAKRAQNNKKGGVLRGVFSSLNMFLSVYFLHFAIFCGGAGFLYSVFLAAEAFFRYAALGYDKEFQINIKR